MANIMTIIADDAFATMLHDGLAGLRQHIVIVANSKDEIDQILAGQDIDLAIVDVDLEGIDPVELVQTMRQTQPALRVMWMPFLGSSLSDEMLAVDIQGLLTKPFFMEDLPAQIDAALGQVMTAPVANDDEICGSQHENIPGAVPEGPASSATRRAAEVIPHEELPIGAVLEILSGNGALKDIVNRLALELDAEVVIVFDREGALFARAGHMPERKAHQLAGILKREIAATNDAAIFLKEKGGHFAHSIHEGEELRVFSAIVSGARVALSAVTRVETPIGSVRYHVRQAAGKLTDTIQSME